MQGGNQKLPFEGRGCRKNEYVFFERSKGEHECAHSRGTNRRERGRGSSLNVKMAGHGVRGFFSAPSAPAFPRANS